MTMEGGEEGVRDDSRVTSGPNAAWVLRSVECRTRVAFAVLSEWTNKTHAIGSYTCSMKKISKPLHRISSLFQLYDFSFLPLVSNSTDSSTQCLTAMFIEQDILQNRIAHIVKITDGYDESFLYYSIFLSKRKFAASLKMQDARLR